MDQAHGDSHARQGSGCSGEGDGHRSREPKRRRRRLLRRFFFVLLALPIVVVGALILLRNPLLRYLLPRVASPAVGCAIHVEEVSISLGGALTLRGLQGSALAEDSPIRSVRFEILTAQIALSRILSDGAGAVTSLAVRGGLLELDCSRPGMPAREPEEPPNIVFPNRIPEISVDLDRLVLRAGDDLASMNGLVLRARADRGGSDVSVRSTLRWRLEDRSGTTPVNLSCRYEGGVVSDVTLAAGSFGAIQGGRFEAGGDRFDVRMGLRSVALDDIVHAVSGETASLKALVNVDVEATIPVADPLSAAATVTARAHLAPASPGTVPSVPPSQLSVEAVLAQRVVEISEAQWTGAGCAITARGLRGSLESLEPEPILASLSGILAVDSESLARAITPFVDRDALDSQILAVLNESSLAARFRLQEGLLFDGAVTCVSSHHQLTMDQGSLDLDVASPSRSGVSASGTLIVQDCAVLGKLLPVSSPELGGSVIVGFSLQGPLRGPVVEASLRGEALRAAGAPPAKLAGEVSWEDGALAASNVVIRWEEEPRLTVEAAGSLYPGEGMLERVTLRVSGSGLPSVARRFPDLARSLPAGPLEVTARLEGPILWPDLDCSITATGFGAGETAGAANVTVVKRGDGIQLHAENVTISECEASIELDGTLDRTRPAGELIVRQLRVGAGETVWERVAGGVLRFDLSESTFQIDPPLTLSDGTGTLLMACSPDEEPGRFTAHLEADYPGELALGRENEHLHLRDLSAELTVRCDLGSGSALPLRGIDVRAGARDVMLPELTGSAEVKTSRLEAHLDLAGDRPVGRALIDVPAVIMRMVPNGPAFREPRMGSLKADVRLVGDRISLEDFQCTLGSVRVASHGTGTLVPDLRTVLRKARTPQLEALSVAITADANDLALLKGELDNAFDLASRVPDLRRLGGSGSVEFHIGGTSSRPEFRGAVVLADAEVRYGSAPPVLALEARLLLEKGHVVIDSCVAEVGGAPVRITGGVRDLFDTPACDIGVNGTDVLVVRSDTARFRSDADLTITGPLQRLQVAGSLHLTTGRVLHAIPLVDFGALVRRAEGIVATRQDRRDVGRTATGFKLFSLGSAPLKDCRFDVAVTAEEPVRITGNIFKGELRPDLHLRGTGEVPYLAGSLYLDHFSFSLPATKVKVESGAIRFDEKKPLFPELNLIGRARSKGYDVTVAVTGTLNEPNVALSSTPSLTATETLLLVTTGQDPARAQGDSERRALLTVAQYFAADVLYTLFGGGSVEDAESILDRFEIETGRNVSRSGRDTWEIRFRVKEEALLANDSLYLVGDQDEFDHYNVGLRLVIHDR